MGTTEVHDGRPVLVRLGGTELQREADLLRELAGTGIPEVVSVGEEAAEVRLVTAVAPPSRARGGAAVPLLATVAGALARAHAAGVVHGPLLDEHLLGPPAAALVSGWDQAGPGDPAGDVRELALLIERLADGHPALLAIAARASAPGHPSMPTLAAALRELASGPPEGAGRARRPRRPVDLRLRVPRPAVVLAAAAAVVAVVAIGVIFRFGTDAHRTAERAAPPASVRPAPPPSSTTTAPATPTTWPAHRYTVDGNVVERDGERWTVGVPGDVVVVGDWTCTGDPVPAVLRPATGEVWRFAGWAPGGEPQAGATLATVPGAVSAHAEAAGRCDRLQVVGADGQSTTVG